MELSSNSSAAIPEFNYCVLSSLSPVPILRQINQFWFTWNLFSYNINRNGCTTTTTTTTTTTNITTTTTNNNNITTTTTNTTTTTTTTPTTTLP